MRESTTDILENVWLSDDLRDLFNEGFVWNESQLHCELFYRLRGRDSLLIFSQPTLYFQCDPAETNTLLNLSYKRPDFVIVNQETNSIEMIIEIKCKPWEDVDYTEDVSKPKRFHSLSTESKNCELVLGWEPHVSVDITESTKKTFKFDGSLTTVFIAVANKQKGSKALERIEGFSGENHCMHLIGFIGDEGRYHFDSL